MQFYRHILLKNLLELKIICFITLERNCIVQYFNSKLIKIVNFKHYIPILKMRIKSFIYRKYIALY